MKHPFMKAISKKKRNFRPENTFQTKDTPEDTSGWNGTDDGLSDKIMQ